MCGVVVCGEWYCGYCVVCCGAVRVDERRGGRWSLHKPPATPEPSKQGNLRHSWPHHALVRGVAGVQLRLQLGRQVTIFVQARRALFAP